MSRSRATPNGNDAGLHIQPNRLRKTMEAQSVLLAMPASMTGDKTAAKPARPTDVRTSIVAGDWAICMDYVSVMHDSEDARTLAANSRKWSSGRLTSTTRSGRRTARHRGAFWSASDRTCACHAGAG